MGRQQVAMDGGQHPVSEGGLSVSLGPGLPPMMSRPQWLPLPCPTVQGRGQITTPHTLPQGVPPGSSCYHQGLSPPPEQVRCPLGSGSDHQGHSGHMPPRTCCWVHGTF